jgi:hypothetical protein
LKLFGPTQMVEPMGGEQGCQRRRDEEVKCKEGVEESEKNAEKRKGELRNSMFYQRVYWMKWRLRACLNNR